MASRAPGCCCCSALCRLLLPDRVTRPGVVRPGRPAKIGSKPSLSKCRTTKAVLEKPDGTTVKVAARQTQRRRPEVSSARMTALNRDRGRRFSPNEPPDRQRPCRSVSRPRAELEPTGRQAVLGFKRSSPPLQIVFSTIRAVSEGRRKNWPRDRLTFWEGPGPGRAAPSARANSGSPTRSGNRSPSEEDPVCCAKAWARGPSWASDKLAEEKFTAASKSQSQRHPRPIFVLGLLTMPSKCATPASAEKHFPRMRQAGGCRVSPSLGNEEKAKPDRLAQQPWRWPKSANTSTNSAIKRWEGRGRSTFPPAQRKMIQNVGRLAYLWRYRRKTARNFAGDRQVGPPSLYAEFTSASNARQFDPPARAGCICKSSARRKTKSRRSRDRPAPPAAGRKRPEAPDRGRKWVGLRGSRPVRGLPNRHVAKGADGADLRRRARNQSLNLRRSGRGHFPKRARFWCAAQVRQSQGQADSPC